MTPTPPRDNREAIRAAVETVLPALLRERHNRVGKHFEHERDDMIIAALEEAKSILSGDRVVDRNAVLEEAKNEK